MLALAFAGALAASAAAPRASSTTVKMVEFFVHTPTADLPPEGVPAFLAVDRAGLPRRLQDPYEAKRMELIALKKNVDGKYKPPVRKLGTAPVLTGEDCGPPREMSSVGLLTSMGFEEITDFEERHLMEDTACSECELRTEFTLELVSTPPPKKGGKRELHYLLHGNDPIMTLIAGYRAGVKTKATSFFGIGGSPKCR